MLKKHIFFYLILKTNNWTLISSSNYVENDCVPLSMLGIWMFWLMINLTGILIQWTLFKKLWEELTQFYPRYDMNNEILSRTIYFAIFYSYLVYVTTGWGQTKILQKHITVLQKKVLVIMSFATFNAHSSSYFHDCNILKFCDVVNVESLCFH